MIGGQWPVEPADPNYPGEVARRWRYRDGQGEFGVIASVTQPFCGGCHRVRLSADGMLYTCLFASDGHDLKSLLRSGADDAALRRDLIRLWEKPGGPLSPNFVPKRRPGSRKWRCRISAAESFAEARHQFDQVAGTGP